MSTHPYTGRPNADYLTLVLERLPLRIPDETKTSALFESLKTGEECTTLPGYRVTGIAIGDEFSRQETEDKEP